jgi:multimeric flavodoxin WrbA
MKTVFINCSPKKRFCASAYFLALQRLFVGGEKVTMTLRTPADCARILEQLHDTQAIVFGLPLYVDGVPSHALHFMQEMEAYCLEHNLSFNVYCIANNGFIEGRQNEPLMQVFENFCRRAGLTWGGGVGIGGGVMLNVTRIMFVVELGLLALNTVLSVASTGDFFPHDAWISFAENAGLLLYFNLGVLFYLARMGSAIRKGDACGKKYTRILIPSFVFILFADIFFVIISLFQGGLFRGWLAKKEYEG